MCRLAWFFTDGRGQPLSVPAVYDVRNNLVKIYYIYYMLFSGTGNYISN
jgi:hypothetical protein